jgi:hypothetical protein
MPLTAGDGLDLLLSLRLPLLLLLLPPPLLLLLQALAVDWSGP